MGYCDFAMNFEVGQAIVTLFIIKQCPDGQWTNYKHNFDDIFEAIPTLFIVSTLDQWDEIL